PGERSARRRRRAASRNRASPRQGHLRVHGGAEGRAGAARPAGGVQGSRRGEELSGAGAWVAAGSRRAGYALRAPPGGSQAVLVARPGRETRRHPLCGAGAERRSRLPRRRAPHRAHPPDPGALCRPRMAALLRCAVRRNATGGAVGAAGDSAGGRCARPARAPCRATGVRASGDRSARRLRSAASGRSAGSAARAGITLGAVTLDGHAPALLARARALLRLPGGPSAALSAAEVRPAARAVLELHQGLVGDRPLARPSTYAGRHLGASLLWWWPQSYVKVQATLAMVALPPAPRILD